MQVTTPSDVKRLGTIVLVWAHPDDESFLAAGIMYAAKQNGQRVVCLTATKGEAGQTQDEQKWPSAHLGSVRERELQAALDILGVSEHRWLGCPDGGCATAAPEKALEQIKKVIEEIRPDAILTFGPDGLTGHPDHQTVSHWVDMVMKDVSSKPAVYHAVHSPEQYEHFKPLDKKLNIYFNIAQPPTVEPAGCAIAFKLPENILEKKRQALACMQSQTTSLLAAIPEGEFVHLFGIEYFIVA